MINKCYTIGKLLCGLDIRMSDCEDRICLMDNILTDFYDYMYGSPLIKVAEGFTGSGSNKIELMYEPYKIEGFYGYGAGCANKNCFTKVASCLDCVCPELYQITMERSTFSTAGGTYDLEYDNDQDKWFLNFNIPAGVDKGYVTYSRTHKSLTSHDEEICIDPRLLPGLKLMIRKYLAINEKEINMAQFYGQELAVRKTNKEKEQAGNLISIITTHVGQLK